MSKCLVTGGAGFIGSNLVDALIGRGDEVIIIDNLATGSEDNLNPRAAWHNLDIRNFDDIKSLFESVDFVFHLAALPNLQYSIDHPDISHEVNATGTVNVLRAAREAGVKKVVYSASSSAYGEQNILPWQEDMTPAPMQPYAVQKYIGELYCRSFNIVYGLPTVSLRYFNIYGPRQKLDGAYAPVMGIFIRERLAGRPLRIFGDGEQSRDFTSVHDVVRANIAAAESDLVGRGEVINIGRGEGRTVKRLAEVIGGQIEYGPARIEVKRSLADTARARELLGWEPEVDLLEWLEEHKREIGLG